MKRNLLILLLAFFIFQQTAAKEACPKSFDESLSQQLKALDNRDLALYMGTIPPREDQLMILPNGSIWTTRVEIEQGHQEWFKDDTWVFERELQRKDVRSDWGVVVYRVSIDRPDSLGKPFLLSMLFASEPNGCWYLQHDQNTLVQETK